MDRTGRSCVRTRCWSWPRLMPDSSGINSRVHPKRAEALLACKVLNRMFELGRPVSKAIRT